MLEARFAVLALALISFLAFQFQRHLSNSRMLMMRSEVQLIASGVGTEYLDEVGTASFEEIAGHNGAVSTNLVILETDTLSFDLTTSVSYVEKQGNAFVSTLDETDYQEVRVMIQGLLSSTVTMSRIYSRVSN